MRMLRTVVVLLSVILITKTSASPGSSLNIILADQDSQFVGEFERSAINVTFNISETANVSAQFLLTIFEKCADAGHPLLFINNSGTVIGCGTLNIRNQSWNAKENSTKTIQNCSSSPCQVNSTDNNTTSINSTSLSSNLKSSVKVLFTKNCSSVPCQVNSTDNITSLNSASLSSNSNANATMITKNCSIPCQVNSTNASINSTNISPNPTESVTMVAENCSSIPCQVKSTNASINSTNISPNSTESVTMVAENCSSIPCQVKSTNASINSTNISPNPTESVTMVAENCSSIPCQVKSTNASINSTNISPNSTESVTMVTNCSSIPCAVNVTNNLTSDLIMVYKTELFTLIPLSVLTNINFSVLLTKMDKLAIQYSFDPGDGNPVAYGKTNATFNFLHVYTSYGLFRTRVQSVGNASTFLDVSRRVRVTFPTVIKDLRCADAVVATNETVSCIMDVVQAMELYVEVNIGDSMGISYKLSATPIGIIRSTNETLRELNCTCSKNNSALSKVLILPSLVFKRKFHIRAIELVSTISGPLQLQILRATDQQTKDLDEFSGNLSCSLNTTSNITICLQTFHMEYLAPPRVTSSTMLTAVHKFTVIVDAGYNFITLSDENAFTANPGDLIGLPVNQSFVFISSPSTQNLSTNISQLTNTLREISSSPFSNIKKSTNSSSGYYPHFSGLSLYGFLPFETRISLRFMNPGEFTLITKFGEEIEKVRSLRQILTVRRPLENLFVFLKSIVRFNSTQSLGFRVTCATNASCTWILSGQSVKLDGVVNCAAGTGAANESMPGSSDVTEFRVNYTHNVPGEYTFNVTCSNMVSNVSEAVPISVRRNVSEFNAYLCFASFAYAHARTCWNATAFGDHVKYTWVIGDSVVRRAQRFTNVFSSPTLPGSQRCLNVTAENVVSKESLVLRLKILKNPLSILISPSSLVASSLSPVFFTPVLSWKGHQNGTEFYQSYSVNSSEGLHQFINSPTFRVKVDDIVMFTNVSNATLLNYTFPVAGSSATTHLVSFEATGHPEMNRDETITVLDKIKRLRIFLDHPSEIIVNKTYKLVAKYDQGSDVICDWQVASWSLSGDCEMMYEFPDLGNIAVHVNASNLISSSKAVLNITVIMPVSSAITVSPSGSLVNRVTSSVKSMTSSTYSLTSSVKSLTSSTYSLTSSTNSHTSSTKPLTSSTRSPSTKSMTSSTYSLTSSTNSLITSSTKPLTSSTTHSVVVSTTAAPPSLGDLVINGPQFVEVGKEVTFNVSCLTCNNSSNLTWTWQLINITQGNSPLAIAFYNLTTNTNKLTIPPYALKPITSYRVEVNVTSSSHSNAYATYEFTTNDLPTGGSCSASPAQGLVLKIAFKFVCQAWYDRHQPLSYEFWYSIDGHDYSLFYYGENPQVPSTYFEAGLPQRNYTVVIKVVIRDSLGETTVKFLFVKNLRLSEDQIKRMLNSPRDVDKRVSTLLNSNNTQGVLQYVKILSGLMNKRSNDNQQRKKRIEIRESLLRHVTQLCCPQGRYLIEQTLPTMLTVSRVPSELNLNSQSYASSIFLKMSERLGSISPKTNIESGAHDLVNGVSFVLTSLLSNNITHLNNNQIRENIDDCLRSIDKVGDALLLRLKPGEPAVVIVTASLIIALQKHYTSNFSDQRLVVPRHLNEFVIPKTVGNITDDIICTKLVSMQNNPFSSLSTQPHTRPTSVVSFVLTDNQAREVVMKDLLEPFSMFLYAPRSSADLPKINATLEEYSTPDLYEINITASNPSLMVTLYTITNTNKGHLRLRIKNHNRLAVSINDVIVSTDSSFPVSWTWRGLSGGGKYYISVEYESSSRFLRAPDKVSYNISFLDIACSYWNNTNAAWETNGCQVGSLSTPSKTHCLCNHLTWFGGRFIVPPNSISLTTVAQRINNPKNYATILGVLSSLCFLYLIAALWARKRDRQDLEKNWITCCPTNHVTDFHQYHVILHTGIRRNAGTTANVGLILAGESGKSRKCLLKDSKNEILQRGDVNTFLVTTTGSLGALEYVHIWHNNTGSNPAWFVNRVVILEKNTGEVWNFLCYRWLAVDEGDGQIQRLLPVADSQELVRFRHLFVSRATSQLTDAHLWFSVAFRPVSSPFTRVQRVSCCLSLLLTSMMTNAMWYGTGGTGKDVVDLGLFSFSWEEISIGVCSSLIILPVNILLVQIFRHCRPKSQAFDKKSPPISPRISQKERSTKRPSFFVIQSVSQTVFLGSQSTSPDDVVSTSHKKHSVSPDINTSRNTSPNLGSQNVTSPSSGVTSLLSGLTSSTLPANSRTNEVTQPNHARALPYWFMYVAWLGVVATCLVSAAVTFLYGIEFGEAKTKKWLFSLTISTLNDVFIAQPLKVLVVAVAFAYLVKKPLKDRYGDHEVTQHAGLESDPRDDLEVPDPSVCNAAEFLKTARARREKDKFMHGLVKTIGFYFVFIIIVLILAYSQRDPNAYYLTRVQENTFTRSDLSKESVPDFGEVANVDDFWSWNKGCFVPSLANIQWYNYTKEWLTFTENFGGFIFGGARWRQKRLKKGICQVLPTMQHLIPTCTGNYEWNNEDSSNYMTSWNKPLINISCSDENTPSDPWCFTSSTVLKTVPYIANLETYSGGGYKKDIIQDYNIALNLTRSLQEHGWIDKYTRAVFIEFTLYNPNVNLFSVVTLLFEISSSGNFNPSADILSTRLYSYVGNFQIFFAISQFSFLAFLSYFTYHSAKLLWREKWSFFRKTWNTYEIFVVLLSWLAVAFYFTSIALRKWTLEEFRNDPGRFTSFVYNATSQMSLEYTTAFLVFLITLKFLRLFQFNRKMFLLPLTLSNTFPELLNYSLVFFIVFTAFTLLYHLMLHSYTPEFANVIVTMETLLQVLLGKSIMKNQHQQYPVLENIILFCYICIMRFVLLNVFVVIVNEGFSLSRAQNNQQKNDFEFVDFVKDNVFEFLGIRRLDEKSENNPTKEIRHVQFMEHEARKINVQQALDELEGKVERVWKLVNSRCFEEDMWC